MSFFDDASLVMIPSGYKDQKVYSVKPIDGSGDLTFSRSNDTATRVDSNGLIEKVHTNELLQSNTTERPFGLCGLDKYGHNRNKWSKVDTMATSDAWLSLK